MLPTAKSENYTNVLSSLKIHAFPLFFHSKCILEAKNTKFLGEKSVTKKNKDVKIIKLEK